MQRIRAMIARSLVERVTATVRQIGWWAGLVMVSLGVPLEVGGHGPVKETTPDKEKATPQGRAKLKVSGYGFWGNRSLKKELTLLREQEKPPRFYDPNFVEDAVLLTLSSVQGDGYLRPRIDATLTLADGRERHFSWETELDKLLPRPLKIKQVHIQVKEGVLYYYRDLEIKGLEVMPKTKARSYFVETDSLLPLKGSRVYTPQRLEQSLSNLREALVRKGYEKAAVTVSKLKRDNETGAIDLTVDVDSGPQARVGSVEVEIDGTEEKARGDREVRRPDAAYSEFWRQELKQEVRSEQLRKGFPDAKVELKEIEREKQNDTIVVDLRAHVTRGPKVTLREVKFQGNERTKRSVLMRQTRLEPDKPLNRIRVEQGRSRLSRLGVFDSVSIQYEKVTPKVRDVIYKVEEGKQVELNLLFGYGSYELVRGGFELDHYNVWGRAHQSRLKAVQSLRSTNMDYLYSTPRLGESDISLFFNAQGLRREEIDFVREEFGAGVGGQRYIEAIDSDASLRYNYELLAARDAESAFEETEEEALSASWMFDIEHDQRDNPLIPREGYNLSGSMQMASEAFGGEVDYQRLEMKGSYHHKLGRGRYLHLGWAHGIALALGGERNEIPINRRFFPGGQNSVRGFQQGEAAPLNEEGKVIGAETFLRGNVELEQALTPTWSVVAFMDGVGFARDVGNYPFQENLLSVGGGVRWNTIIGPARLEYGHNLNPREHDPGGTFHFSIGFPF